MLGGESGARRLRTWRAGRSDLRLHLQSVFSLSVAFVCLAASLLVVSNIEAVRDRWSRAGRATIYLRDGASEAEVATLTSALTGTPGVTRVHVISSAEARREVVTVEQDKLLAALPPTKDNATTMKREVVLVIDRSGSMQGTPLLLAQSAALATARALGPDTDETYWKASASFEQGGVTGSIEKSNNDWDLLFGNNKGNDQIDLFQVNTVVDDRLKR